jgi:outer membrane protein
MSAFAQEQGAAGVSDGTPAPAAAQSGGRVFLGVRSGFAVPFGAFQSGSAVGDYFAGYVPIWLDAGYKVTPNLMLGLYGQYGFLIWNTASALGGHGCPSALDCSASVIRFGAQIQYHILPGQSMNPWVGFGLGYEIFSSSVSGTDPTFGSVESKESANGFEFGHLQAGLDFKAAKGVGVGPFLGFSLGQSSSCSQSLNGTDLSCTIDHKTMHEWLTLGVRGAFEL